MPVYRWTAKYKDGTIVSQFDKEGLEISSEKVDRDKVEAFALYDPHDVDPKTKKLGKSVLTVHLEGEKKLIYRRRVEMNTAQKEPVEVCHLVGWRETVNGKCEQSIAYVFENSERIELAGKFREDHPWFYKVELRPFEKSVGE